MSKRLELALTAAIGHVKRTGAPPMLAAALDHAVFPGGARVRPRLCLAVAQACGDDVPSLSDAAACAIELLHCGSLVHDDMPCFDDAATRRGLPSVHAAYGEAIALLVGDGLIVQSFEVIAVLGDAHPRRAMALVRRLGQAASVNEGIVAGQAWESEENPPLRQYHQAKTGALFRAATTMGAIAAGADPISWEIVGDRIGEAYQVADDLLDAVGDAATAGKPVHRDAEYGRPSAVTSLGLTQALARFEQLVVEAMAAVPDCRGQDELRELLGQIATRLVPMSLRRQLAA